MTYTDQFKAADKSRTYMAVRGCKAVDLINPTPEMFDPEDIAYSLAYEHRYGGNYGPYSVAQHAVLVCQVTQQLRALEFGRAMGMLLAGEITADDLPSSKECLQLALGALHHDDTEAVTGDTPQPVKSCCPDLKALEKRLEAAIMKRYDVDTMHPLIKEADRIVFCAEVRCLVPNAGQHLYGAYGDPTYRRDMQPDWAEMDFWSPDVAAKRYLSLHYRLTEAIEEITRAENEIVPF